MFNFKDISKGVQLSFITALISGVSVFVNSFAVNAIKPPLVFTSTKNFGVGVILLTLLVVSGKWKKFKHINKKDISSLLIIAVIGGSVPFYLFFTGLSMIPAVTGALIHKSLVFWVALLAGIALKERFTKGQLIGVSLIFISNFFVGGFSGFKFSIGELYVLGATLLWAVETVIAKRLLRSLDPDLLSFGRMFLGSILLVVASFVRYPGAIMNISSISSIQLFWLLLTMIFLLGYVLSWYRALQIEGALVVSSILVISTLITNLLSAIFVTHKWGFFGNVQNVLLILGVFLVLRFYRVSKDLTTFSVQ